MSTEAETMGDEAAKIEALVAALGADDARAPRDARQRLVELGGAAVPSLVAALESETTQRRWEAAKALGEIGAPGAAPSLARTLQDDDGGVRWVAADALIAIGQDGLPAVLHALIERSKSSVMREGAHHVLKELAAKPKLAPILSPVIQGLEGQASEVACLGPAEDALKTLEQH